MTTYFAVPSSCRGARLTVLRATEMGMCFGVRDALAALDGVAAPATVTVHGELVHNAEVLRALDHRGFHRSPETARAVPTTETVLVTAHGISERERERLRAHGKTLLDTTCPLVQKAHAAAQELQAEDRRVVVIGRSDHVEVRGIVEDLQAPIVVGSLADVRRWPDRRLGIVCQTTTQDAVAQQLLLAIRAANPHADVAFRDTVCAPTKARVAALAELLPRIDGLVVVGGRDSNNTRQLVAAAAARNVPALHVENEYDIVPAWFADKATIGLTAGTSTLATTIDAVNAALLQLP